MSDPRSPAGSGAGADRTFAGFVSYSHAADRRLATAVQQGLHGFAKPWYRIRALRVFRDDASLTANPGLWQSIAQALAASEYFILLASPDAARSEWVGREIGYWREHRSVDQLLIVLTDGELVWDHATGDLDWARTTAVHPALRNAFSGEPRYVDLRWARSQEQVTPRDPRFREALADLAAPLHHRPKDDLIGEDVRQHRRSLRLARSAVAALVVLTVLAGTAAVIAVVQRNTARQERDTALSRQLNTQSQTDLVDELSRSVLLGLEALHLRDTPETRGGLLATLTRSPGLRQAVEAGVEPLTAVAWSPTEDRLAWGEIDGDVVLWDVEEVRREHTVHAHPFVSALAFSPDGRRLVSGGTDGTVRVWDLTSSRPEQVREMTHGGEVDAVEFSPGGHLVASAGDGEVALWAMASQERVGPAMPGSEAAFSPDGRTIAVASGDRVDVWDFRTGAVVDSAASPAEGVQEVLFDSTGTTLATSSIDGLVVLWDLGPLRPRGGPLDGYETRYEGELGPSASDFPLRTIGPGDKDFHSIAFSPDGTVLASGGIDDRVVFWDVRAREPLGFYPTTRHELVYGIAFSREGDSVATATAKGDVLIWDNGSEPRLTRSVGRHDAWVNDVAVSRDGEIIVSGARDGRISVWDVSEGTAVGEPLQHPGAGVGGVMGVALGPDGRTLVSSGGRVVLWDLDRRELLAELGSSSGTVGVAFSPDGSTVASADGDTVQVWDVDSRSRTPLAGHRADVNAVAYSTDGRTLASAGADGRILLWDLETGKRSGQLVGEDGRIFSLALSPDGRTIASGGGVRGGDVTLWDRRTGDRVAVLTGHDDLVSALAFTPDGSMLISGSHDGSVFLWDVDNRARVGPPLRGHTTAIGTDLPAVVQAAALGGDGTTMASGGSDGRVVAWDLRLDRWIDWACELAARNLTQVEWNRFLLGRDYRRTCADLPSGAGAPADAPAAGPG